jgi:C1A family cysteine protease
MNYYTRINRSVSGPFTEEELLLQIRSRTVSMLDEVSTDGINWRRLGMLPIYRGANAVATVKARGTGASGNATSPGGANPPPNATSPQKGKGDSGSRLIRRLLEWLAGMVIIAVVIKVGELLGINPMTWLFAARGGLPIPIVMASPKDMTCTSEAGINPAYEDFVRRESDEPDARSLVGRSAVEDGNFGYVPELRDLSYLSSLESASRKSLAAGTPPQARLRKFDLRAEKRVTSARDQGMYGTCWAQAAIGSVESSWKQKTGRDVDLSENNLVNGHGWHRTGWFGNTADTAESYFLSWRGAYLENDDPYAHPSAVASGKPAMHLQEVRWIPGMRDASDTARIKSAIVSWGGLWTAYCCGDQKLSKHNGFYYNGTNDPNHAVLVVGWDDDFSKEKFLVQPPGNGAWLVKNSWGDDYGDKGFFYVSYFDRWFAKDKVGPLYAFCGVESADNYSRIYQHDPFGFVEPFKWSSGKKFPDFGANVFVAAADETIAAVGLYALGPNTSYQISVWKGLEAVQVTWRNDPAGSWNPASGVRAIESQSGTFDTAGFFTVPLAKPVPVSKGEPFSVIVKLETPGKASPLASELREKRVRKDGMVVEVPSPSVESLPGESFFSFDGRQWCDVCLLKEFDAYQPNLCIKAYARRAESARNASDRRQELDAGGVSPSADVSGGSTMASAFLSPSERDIVSVFAQVRDSPAVAGNSKYQHVAAGIDCHVVADDSLNAYAHWKRLESGARIREICYHAGHARFDRVVGAIACKTVAADGGGEEQAKAMLALVVGIPKALRESRYRIDAETAESLLAVAGVGEEDFSRPGFAENARKVADGIALSTLSHEMGHHLLGHLDGDSNLAANMVFGRAEEEQADLFATQVMAAAGTEDGRRQIFMGRFFWSLIVASTEQDGSDEDRTHPATRRRLRNLIESDPATARELGVSVEMVDKIIDIVAGILDGKNN